MFRIFLFPATQVRVGHSLSSEAKSVFGLVVRWKSSTVTTIGHPETATLDKSSESVANDSDIGRKATLDLSFSNHVEAFKSKSTFELFRALAVFKLCSYQFIVDRNLELMKLGRKILGDRLFNWSMKKTFFGHFVAGENEKDIKLTVDKLRKFGVKAILDYSAEEDISTAQAERKEMKAFSSLEADSEHPQTNKDSLQFQAHREFADRRKDVVAARTYFYENEAQCEKNMEIFLNCIDAVSDSTNSSGLAAIKMTALGRPNLLMQLSEVIVRTRSYFRKVTGESVPRIQNSFLSRREFEKHLEQLKVSTDREDVRKWLEQMDYDKKGLVHMFSWSGLVDMNHLLSDVFKVPNLQTGRMETFITALTDDEEEMFKNMMRRLHTIARRAREKKVRVMVDAEQTYFQPAINRITMELMRKYNKKESIIFNTYQCYLKDTYNNLVLDLELAKRQNIYFGAKLVRGAYIEQERARAKSVGYEDPTNPDYDSTNAMYERTLTECLRRIKESNCDQTLAVMVASHNEDTVRYTVEKMEEMGIRKMDRVVCFGQLYGMCDQVSFILGQSGYSVYKYLPYGPIQEVLPYLSRRAIENSSLLKNATKEREMLLSEFKRRLKSGHIFA